MSEFADRLLLEVKKTLREASEEFDEEIKSYIDSCAEDLQDVGILTHYFIPLEESWKANPKILQAVRLYCLSLYGLYNTDMEKYDKAYRSLKSTLATQKKYTEGTSINWEEILKAKLTKLSVIKNGEYLPEEGKFGYSSVFVDIPDPVLEELKVTQNGEYLPEEGQDGFSSVKVDIYNFAPRIIDGRVAVLAYKEFDGVSTIRNYAFSNCSLLSYIQLPPSVNHIEKYAFSACTNLSSISIKDLSAYCRIVYDNTQAQPLYYARNLILNGKLIKDLVIPDEIEIILNNAFRRLSADSVTLGSGVEIIDIAAFGECENLKKVILKNNNVLSEIKGSAFSDCLAIQEIDFSEFSGSSVPILSNVNAFKNVPTTCIFKVPYLLVTSWKTATNWVDFSDQIIADGKGTVGTFSFHPKFYTTYELQIILINGISIGRVGEMDKAQTHEGVVFSIRAGYLEIYYVDVDGNYFNRSVIEKKIDIPLSGYIDGKEYVGIAAYTSSYSQIS